MTAISMMALPANAKGQATPMKRPAKSRNRRLIETALQQCANPLLLRGDSVQVGLELMEAPLKRMQPEACKVIRESLAFGRIREAHQMLVRHPAFKDYQFSRREVRCKDEGQHILVGFSLHMSLRTLPALAPAPAPARRPPPWYRRLWEAARLM